MKSPWSKLGVMADERNKRFMIAAGALVILIFLFVLPGLVDSGDAVGMTHLRLDKFPENFRIAVIADLDQSSKKEGKNAWNSIYMTGTLHRSGKTYEVTWDAPAEVGTPMNEGGRGCELSELVRFGDSLLTFDDRTGIMFEVTHPERSDAAGLAAPGLLPRGIYVEGDGHSSSKGMKFEWATTKDGVLYAGSFGKEFTDNKGAIQHANNLWVVALRKDGTFAHVDWRANYGRVRSALGYDHPGYLLHETVVWSPHRRKWFILPRRMSTEPYNDVEDEKRGANTIIMASHDFADVAAVKVGVRTPERGFSSAKFLPGSRDGVLIALKSEENAEQQTQKTYLVAYEEQPDGTWVEVLPETPLPVDRKFEGIEVLSAA